MKSLIVIDMQKDFCYPEGSLYIGDHVKRIFKPVSDVIKTARGKIPVIFTQDWHRPDDSEFKIWKPHCVANTTGAEIIDEIDVKDEDYTIKKRRYSAFFGTDLDLTLRELGVKEIFVIGVVTNICVLHTVADALLRGYKVHVLEDCTTALTDYDLEYGIKHMRDVLNAEIITSEEFKLRV
jgi:nicotinamidase-related amidase